MLFGNIRVFFTASTCTFRGARCVWEDVLPNYLLPHEPLHQARFLRPFETPLQENISSSHVDCKEPYCLQPKSVIMLTVHELFDK